MAPAGEKDILHLRRAIALSWEAKRRGRHPFAAVLVGPDGAVLMEQQNAFPEEGGTGHAERVLATRAEQRFGARFLHGCTLVSSAEPCAMCAGAAYWAGIGRVVYALSERRLKALIGPHPENLTLDLPCRTVFAAGQRPVEVVGPLLEEEAEAPHIGAWATE